MWNLVHTAEMKQDFHHDILSCEYQEELDSVLKEEEELMKRAATKAAADQLEEWKARAEAEDKINIKTKGTKKHCTGKRRASISVSSVPYVTLPGYINSHERRPLSYRVKKDNSVSKTKYLEIKSLAERLFATAPDRLHCLKALDSDWGSWGKKKNDAAVKLVRSI
ncbi:hypothetical protein NUU61_002526 [Penicillium alfredii]|uniref:Uncharacterized protein n=1 Tax=Penicillium alfredii TaxID=1506179 RepID=A0A9W9KG24_9EURO|nr:uncharacterized protein NUU61_002526 [Penicillium alfredii]KAJ5105179.1 hypothetical protein NUU61_002526 [Penicillium alfredii]